MGSQVLLAKFWLNQHWRQPGVDVTLSKVEDFRHALQLESVKTKVNGCWIKQVGEELHSGIKDELDWDWEAYKHLIQL